MIEQSEAMTFLVEACPSFSEAWQRHCQENGNELLYIAAGEFAAHLLALYKANDRSSFTAIGKALERLHVEGSPWVKEFATIGVLEAIQNVWSNNGEDPEQFSSFLGQESLRQWASLNNFWTGKALNVTRMG